MDGATAGGRARKEGLEGGAKGALLAIYWAAAILIAFVLGVHPNAAVCDIYVVKLLFRDTLPRYKYT